VTGNVPTSARHPTELFGRARALISVAGVLVGACTSVPARTALSGDLPALKAAIDQAEKQDRLGPSRLAELARAVLERELASLSAPDDTFPDVTACARHIRPALQRVAGGSSEYSAPAALALIDAGFFPPRPRAAEPSGQAVEARLAVGPRAGARRRAFMLHGDASVRRAALSAALASRDRADVGALAEAARLDPDAEARSLAIRALGHIGGDAAVAALVDVYAAAAPADRGEIVLAWSTPASFGAGGDQELEDLAQGSGEPSVLAAIALLERTPDSALASAALVRAIEGAKIETRLLAIEAGPWSDEAVRAAIIGSRKHKDPATRVLGLWRVAVADALDGEATGELEKLGSDGVTPVGAVARAALALAGKGAVKPALRADLAAKEAGRRTLAALSLFELGDWPGTARALGDDSPRVRRAVACQVLADPAARRATLAWSPSPGAGAPIGVVPLLLSAKSG
jgi:hypothetical protein